MSVFQHISSSDGCSPKHFIEAQWALGGVLVTLLNHQMQKIIFLSILLKFSQIPSFNVTLLFHRKETIRYSKPNNINETAVWRVLTALKEKFGSQQSSILSVIQQRLSTTWAQGMALRSAGFPLQTWNVSSPVCTLWHVIEEFFIHTDAALANNSILHISAWCHPGKLSGQTDYVGSPVLNLGAFLHHS